MSIQPGNDGRNTRAGTGTFLIDSNGITRLILYRLAYAWVIVDQELSLFQDIPPKLSLADINTEFPKGEILWQAKSAEEWLNLATRDYSRNTEKQLYPSLAPLFRQFMDDGASMKVPTRGLSPLQLRAILHPLQRLTCHLHECLSCFSSGGSNRQALRLMGQLEEVQATLQQWYQLSSAVPQKPSRFCSATFANLLTYHLISLNVMTCFRDMEALARGETTVQNFCTSFWAKSKLRVEKSQIYVHCGQVLNLVRMMPERDRPPWWAAAVYRVCISMWATCIANNSSSSDECSSSVIHSTSAQGTGLTFPIDGVMPEHPSIARYLRFNEGSPVFKLTDGETSAITPINTLNYCVVLLQEAELETPLLKGISNRLEDLAMRADESAG